METLNVSQLAERVPGGIADERSITHRVEVCGANCADNVAVASLLRGAGVQVVLDGCHGTRGGCSRNGELLEGAYATYPQLTETGVVPTEVAVNLG